MSATPRLLLPFLSAGQAQKEFTHNEALQTLDLAVGAAIEEPPRSDPPTAPEAGACYIVGAAPSGEWSGKTNFLAGFTSGGWRFVAPLDGFSVYVRNSEVVATYRNGAWDLGTLRGTSVVLGGQQVVGSRGAGIGLASGGTTVDSEARDAINSILAALRAHGLIDN